MAAAGAQSSDAGPTAWVELSLRVPPADADLLAEALGALASGGVSVEEAVRTLDDRDFAYQAGAEDARVRVYFAPPLPSVARRALRRRLAALPLSGGLPRLRYSALGEADLARWADAWKERFTTFRVGERLVVRPSWEPLDARAEDLVVTLDPGRAFGTGQHETTRLCLRALEQYLRPGAAVLDVGTGSGILALAAARLGAERVRALDTDATAVAVARENVERNGLGGRVEVTDGSLGPEWPWPHEPRGRFDLVLANISSAAVIELLPAAAAALRPQGLLVASGFLGERAGEVEAASAAAGLVTREVVHDGEWCALVAVRAAG